MCSLPLSLVNPPSYHPLVPPPRMIVTPRPPISHPSQSSHPHHQLAHTPLRCLRSPTPGTRTGRNWSCMPPSSSPVSSALCWPFSACADADTLWTTTREWMTPTPWVSLFWSLLKLASSSTIASSRARLSVFSHIVHMLHSAISFHGLLHCCRRLSHDSRM